jgi:hypothetical protein
MKELFQELVDVEGVLGVLLFNEQGLVVYRDLANNIPEDPSGTDWWMPFIDTLNGIKEFEGVYPDGRVYIRRAPTGYLMIWMDATAPMAMIRLNCDILLHGLKGATPKRRFKGFFRKRV